MKRFWAAANAVAREEGWGVELDRKPLRTPAREPLNVPTKTLAEAIAEEWDSVEGEIDPRAMPLTGLANAAIDRIQSDRAAFAARLAQYAEGDLACYRADSPTELVTRQAELWDALLGWARRRYDIDFCTTSGLLHVAQPPATVERLAHAVAALDPFHLAALSPLTTIGGSLVAALGVLEGAFSPEHAWDAVSLDERWQLERWGSDSEAEAALEGRRRNFLAAAHFLQLLED